MHVFNDRNDAMKTVITHPPLTKFCPVRVLWRSMILTLSCTVLAGCAGMAPPPPGPSTVASDQAMNRALLRQVSRIASLADNIRATSGTTWSPHYNGFTARTPDQRPHGSTAATMMPKQVAGPLGQKVYVQWSGSATVFLKALAGRMDYGFQSHLRGMPSPDVAINANGYPILDVLRTVAIQLPDDMTVKADPGMLILERDGGGDGS
jgi:hypothetical protein